MHTQIPVPSKGDGLRASWGAAVAGRVNELCAMAPARMLAREGFGGMGAQPLPQNLRDRRTAGRPMPFDLKAAVETNEAGTQKRLVVKWYYGGVGGSVDPEAAVFWNYWSLEYTGHEAPGQDISGYITVYTGSWAPSEGFSDRATIQLWYDLQLGPNFGTTPIQLAVSGHWRVVSSDQAEGLGLEEDISPSGPNPTISSHIGIGVVRASEDGIVGLCQQHHGNLYINELPWFGDEPGGGGEDATNGTNYPMPFQYKRTDVEDSQGNVTSSYSIINCRFYWDGAYHVLADYVPPATGTVYLKATKQGAGAGAWTFSLVTQPVANPTAENQTVRLYDFNASKIIMDYRTTALTFGPGPRDYFKVEKSDGSVKASLDATGTSAKATIEGASHNVVIDAANAKNDDVQLRECNYYNGSSSTPTKVDVLASAPMTLGAPPAASAITGISFSIENNKLKATLTKTNLRTGATSTEDVDVCDVHELNVVTNTDYTNPNFSQSKQSITVIGAAPSSSDAVTNVFTTTPLSAETT